MQSLSNYQLHFFTGRTKTFTICMETQKIPNSQSNHEKEEWSRRNQASWLQTILQSYSHQNSMVLAQERNIDQWNKREMPEINPCTISWNLIFNKEGMTTPWGKDNLFSTWFWENWTAMCKRMKLEYHTWKQTWKPNMKPLYMKINSKWNWRPNVRTETMKLLEENIGRTLFDINHNKILKWSIF